MTTFNTLKSITKPGLLAGFGSLFHKELRRWWGTWHWLMQILVWLLLINGMFVLIVWVVPPLVAAEAAQTGQPAEELPGGMEVFVVFHGMLGAIGSIVLAQSAIISERESGTAAWVLSKPVSRGAFILTKFLSDSLGVFITLVVVQVGVVYVLDWTATGVPGSVGRYIGASVLLTLNLLFYLAFALMLGTYFRSRGPILGVALAFLFLQYQLTQFGLVTFAPGWLPILALSIIQGGSLPFIAPIISTIILIPLLIATAIWCFNREEF
jgi:ABC-2 type transport system permease protein